MPAATITMNGRPVQVDWTEAAATALAHRESVLYVELELYFSCLVKKFVHFREDSRDKASIAVTDKLHLYFRPVTSTACTWDVAERLGRQPEKDIDSEALHRVAPKTVFIDYRNGEWCGRYEFV